MMRQKRSDCHLSTLIVHPHDEVAAGWDALPVPVTRASTVVFPNVEALRLFDWRNEGQWNYGLHATPITVTLAQRLAALEGGQQALLQPSGLAAISNVYFGMLKQGDDVLIQDSVYTPNREHGDWLAQNFGISARYYDPMIGAGIEALIQPNTRLIWIEAPGSVTMEVPNVDAMTQVARAHGVVTALDNTYSAGIAFKPFEHGCDIVVQALTKYQSGGSDVLMGATITVDPEIHMRLKRARMHLGFGVSADDCALILRNLASLTVRYAAHDRSAYSIAQWLRGRPEVTAVLHPSLSDCPGHEYWKRHFTAAGGLFSVVFNEAFSQEAIDAFIEGLRFFKIGFSWGGAHSLAVPYRVPSMRTARHWPYEGSLVRFYIGLEDQRDLQADLEHSMTTHLICKQPFKACSQIGERDAKDAKQSAERVETGASFDAQLQLGQ